MRLHTASEVISFCKKLETESAKLYRDMSGKYPANADFFNSMAKENEGFTVQVERAYYSVISDAIEGGFAFDIESDDYALDTLLSQNSGFPNALGKIISIEETITKFYSDAARQSDSLMADIPRAFKQVVKKREGRLEKIKQLA
ncbi:MAG: hypothetical protein A2Y90_02500 [Chloroflexi bacterium RBG_13_52_12]|nr:MAG: hypothetical protein A2Y90_02500 [Chloroflexi bacterium RBG_13_52_12]